MIERWTDESGFKAGRSDDGRSLRNRVIIVVEGDHTVV
jgi:hypothetical protein